LRDDGRFALIVPGDKAGIIIDLAAGKKLFPVKQLNVKPTETKPVNRINLEFGYSSQLPEEYSLTVRTGNIYSGDYQFVTRDFYL
jgi:tRNA1Val (adenine37-N6)-methyltransferase